MTYKIERSDIYQNQYEEKHLHKPKFFSKDSIFLNYFWP